MPVTFSTPFTGITFQFYIENLSKNTKAKNQVVPIRTVEQIAGGTKTSIDDGFQPYYINLGYTETIKMSGYVTTSTEISNIIDYFFPDVLLTVSSSTIDEFPSSSTWEIKSVNLTYQGGFSGVRKYDINLTRQYNSGVR